MDFAQVSFNVGVVSPEVKARIDLDGKYPYALKELKNFIPLAHGPVTRRMGLEFIAEAKNHDKECRLVPFEFNTEQAYILEYGDLYIRFFKDGGVIGAPYEVVTTYTEALLQGLDFAQLNDTQYIACSSKLPRTLVRSDHASWAISDITHETGPFIAQNSTSTTLAPSATTGGITITASAVTGINNDQGFISTDVGRLVAIENGAPLEWGIARITSITSTTVVNATVVDDFGATTAMPTWKLGAWSDTTGFPKTVTFDNDRLCWAYLQTLWLSKVGLYADHGVSEPLVDDDALALTINTAKANTIQWIESAQKFAIGTTGAEWWLTSASGEGPITATSKYRSLGSSHGCEDVAPVSVGDTILFTKRHGHALQELEYTYESNSFRGEEASLLISQLLRDEKILQMDFQEVPHRVLWCVTESGKLFSLTYYKEHKVYGWAWHETEGLFESVAVIPGTPEDEVWFVVKRTVNGSTKRYIERMAESFKPGKHDDTTDAFYVDSGLSLDNRQTIESISYANPGVITVTGHGYSDGDSITIRALYEDDKYGVDGYIDDEDKNLHYERFTVYAKTANTFQLKDVSDTVMDLTNHYEVVSATVAENVTSISGLSHLEGESVTVMADGSDAEGLKTVSGGAITLTASASVIHVGLGYTSDLETLPQIVPLNSGVSMGQVNQIKNLILMLDESLGFNYGPAFNDLKEYDLTTDAVPLGRPAQLFHGFTDEISFGGPDDRAPTVCIRQGQPLPLKILAILTDVEV